MKSVRETHEPAFALGQLRVLGKVEFIKGESDTLFPHQLLLSSSLCQLPWKLTRSVKLCDPSYHAGTRQGLPGGQLSSFLSGAPVSICTKLLALVLTLLTKPTSEPLSHFSVLCRLLEHAKPFPASLNPLGSVICSRP